MTMTHLQLAGQAGSVSHMTETVAIEEAKSRRDLSETASDE